MVISTVAARADSATTRIEPRPFYGATVTLEEGVRVFRPLPPHDRVIINPNNTPVYLGFSESHSYSYGSSPVYAAEGPNRPYAAGLWGPGGKFRGHKSGRGGHHRSHGRPAAGGR
jgi:hypothetical protein